MSDRLAPKIEAILYLKGQPLSLSQITEYAGCDRIEAKDALLDLIDDYAHRESALEVVETEGGYSLQLREAFQDVMQALVPAELGVGALRTLAAIALKGPLLQTDLVELRGSGAYQHVQELMQLGLIRRRRSEGNGRSYLVQVTEKFHQYFHLENLPMLAGMVIPDREDEAEADEYVVEGK
jgi:segregation and condensation protein B